jgi:ribonuclease HI
VTESSHGSETPVIIYTDGGCVPNPGVGGWAAVLQYNGQSRELSGGETQSTNNRMELMAAIEALRALKRRCRVELHTDSEYVKRGVTEWLPAWKSRNWKRKTGPVKNEDLWRILDLETQRHDIVWKWVRGHAGIELNERCDVLAAEEIRKRRSG